MSGALFVLDGPDATGKTTLAGELIKYHGKGKCLHLTYVKDDREMWRTQYLALYQASVLLARGECVVIDRHWMSEHIYAGVYRGKSGMPYEARAMDRVIQRLAGVYIICTPRPSSAVERHRAMHESREEMYAPGPEILQVARRYWDLWHGVVNPGLPQDAPDYAAQISRAGGMRRRSDALRYDIETDGGNMARFVRIAFERAAARSGVQLPACLDHHSPNMLGHPSHAEFLFLGDRINPRKNGVWPFVDFGASSRTLGFILHSIAFDETRGMWANAHGPGPCVVFDLIERKPLIKVIALGDAAEKWAMENQIAIHARVCHPSFARDFGCVHQLREELETALV